MHIAAFNESGSLIRPGWVSERFTKRVMDELKTVRGLSISKGTPVESNDLLLDRARKGYAHLAMTGTIRVLPNQLEASSELLDVLSGNSLGTMKAQGAPRDIFAIEESFARQAKQLVEGIVAPQTPARPATPATTVPPTAPTAPPAGNSTHYQGSGLQESVSYPEQSPYTQTVDYDDGYSYVPTYSPYWNSGWGNGWGWGDWPTVIIIQQSNDSDGHHHGHHGGSAGGGGGTSVPRSSPGHEIPSEIRTRGQNGSLVATPLPNTIVDPRAPGVQNTITNTTAPGVQNTINAMPGNMPAHVTQGSFNTRLPASMMHAANNGAIRHR
jgi:hypothetical protein